MTTVQLNNRRLTFHTPKEDGWDNKKIPNSMKERATNLTFLCIIIIFYKTLCNLLKQLTIEG